MIGGEIGRPGPNSTGPGTPMPMPHSRPGMSCVVRSKESNSASTRSSARSGPSSIRAGSSWWPRIRPSRLVTATSMLVAPRSATRTMPGVRAEGEVPWWSSAGTRADVAFAQQPAIDQLLDPPRDDRPAEAGPFNELGAGSRPPEADLVEHRDQRVEDLVGKWLMRPDDRRAYQLCRPLTHHAMIAPELRVPNGRIGHLGDHGRVMESAGPDALRTASAAVLATVLAVAACAGTTDSPAPTTTTPEVTPMEGPWIALFDGSSTAALRGYGAEAFPPSWVVEDGELHALPGTGVDLITRETFGDFELEFEWRVEPGWQQRGHLPGRRERRAIVDDRPRIPGARRWRASGRRRSADLGRGALRADRPERRQATGGGRHDQHGADRRPRRAGRALAQRQPCRRLRVERRRRANARSAPASSGICRASWRPTPEAWSSSTTARRSGSGTSGSAG